MNDDDDHRVIFHSSVFMVPKGHWRRRSNVFLQRQQGCLLGRERRHLQVSRSLRCFSWGPISQPASALSRYIILTEKFQVKAPQQQRETKAVTHSHGQDEMTERRQAVSQAASSETDDMAKLTIMESRDKWIWTLGYISERQCHVAFRDVLQKGWTGYSAQVPPLSHHKSLASVQNPPLLTPPHFPEWNSIPISSVKCQPLPSQLIISLKSLLEAQAPL